MRRSLPDKPKSRAHLDPPCPEGESRGYPPTVGDAARDDDRDPHRVDDLGHQRHCTDHAGPRTAAETAAMPASVKSLRNNDIGAVRFEPTGLGDGRCRAENDAVRFFEPPHGRHLQQTEMEADDAWPELEDEVQPILIESR